MKKRKSRNPVRAKGNTKAKAVGKKKRTSKIKQVDIAKVRDAVTNIVGAEATDIARAVVEEAKKGQVSPTKYLFEMAGVYPKPPQEEEQIQEGQGSDALMKLLLDQLKPPANTDEDEEEGESPAAAAESESGAKDAPAMAVVEGK